MANLHADGASVGQGPVESDFNPPVPDDARRRRARFRAWHRGIREMDLIMGRFADREIDTLSETDLALFEMLMEEPDTVVYGWLIGRSEPPPAYDGPLLARLRAPPHTSET